MLRTRKFILVPRQNSLNSTSQTFSILGYGADGLRGIIRGDDIISFNAYDPQGNLLQVVGPDGTLGGEPYFYSAYGLPYQGQYSSSQNPPSTISSGGPNPGFGQQYGYLPGPDGLYHLGTRWYDPALGRFLNRDTIGYQGGPNLYAYCGNNPITRSDPEGTDWFDYLSDYAAGAGSSLTFGATDRINSWLGDSAYVNQNSASYNAGVWTEVGVETVATLGSGGLKHLAARSIEEGIATGLTKADAMRAIRNQGLRFIKKDAGEIAHHANPLFGHPFGRVPTVFPTGGLSPAIANGSWNIERLTSATAHVARHNWVEGLDRVAPMIVNPSATSSRALRNLYNNVNRQ